MNEEADDLRHGTQPVQPPASPDLLQQQTEGRPDPRPGPATGDQPYDDR
ncbi:hypothetical protein ACVDFE_02030 [Lentzea chajnantorensis]